MGRSSTAVGFFNTKGQRFVNITEASSAALFKFEGKLVDSFIGAKRVSLSKFDDGALRLDREGGEWLEWNPTRKNPKHGAEHRQVWYGDESDKGANCDWGHHDEDVRLLPLGGSSNAILCRRHYNEEMAFRRERAKETGSDVWEFPTWESLKKYNPNPPRAGRKDYHLQHNIGKARHVVSFHDGNKQHSDGSAFYDVKIFHNKRELTAFLKKLEEQGYVERNSAFGNPPEKPKFGTAAWQEMKIKSLLERVKSGEMLSKEDNYFLAIQEMSEKRHIGHSDIPALREAIRRKFEHDTLKPSCALRQRGLARHPHLNPLDPREEQYVAEYKGVTIYRNRGNGMYYARGYGAADTLTGMKNAIREEMKGYPAPSRARFHGNPVSCTARRGRVGSAPKGAVLIGRQVKAVEYYDEKKARAEGLANPTQPWRHDYKAKDASVYGLKDGSVLIKGRGKKKLWGYR